MRCVDFERELQELLDENPDGLPCYGELPPTLEIHSSDCDHCRGLAAGYRQLFAGLASLPPAVASTQLTDRILATGIPGQRRTSFRRTLTLLATAASVVLMISLIVATRNPAQKPLEVTPTQIAVPQKTVVVPEAIADSKPLPAPVAFSPVRTRLELDQASVGVMLNLAGLSPVTFSAEVLEAHLAQQPAWANGLKPVKDSMTGTINALLRVLPGNSESTDQNQGARSDRYSRYDLLV